MGLYRSKEHPDHWIGEDEHGVLMVWPAQPRGWTKRTGYTGAKRQLEECEPALARGTGWPFGPVGRKPRGSKPSSTLGIRATDEERVTWRRAAELCDQNLTVWARDELNEAAARVIREHDTRSRSKGKPTP